MASPERTINVAIVGAGTIGLSFTALHLSVTDTRVTIYDPRADLEEYIGKTLPGMFEIFEIFFFFLDLIMFFFW